MDELLAFYQQFGLISTAFAIIGIIALGILKYCNVFKTLPETTRHCLYILISVAISVIISIIYLLATDSFDVTNVVLFATNVYVLNQAFYNIFKATTLTDLIKKILDKLAKK